MKFNRALTRLKVDLMAQWLNREWTPQNPGQEWLTVRIDLACVNARVISKFDLDFSLADDFRFKETVPLECPVAVRIHNFNGGEVGAFLFRFDKPDSEESIEIPVLSSNYTDQGHLVALACIPEQHVEVWHSFESECKRILHAFNPEQRVYIIGGRLSSFVPNVEWDEIILPEKLKSDLLNDIQSFFRRGKDVYKRLNLKPFRKLMLAGVPGTGKTMLCNALAKWALDQGYLVIYISSADYDGPTFRKIDQALEIASTSRYPTLILLEELDAYLHRHEKAIVLNVLDGAESVINDHGTLLIATTNYPEAIDERILKRPGRLDRIFVIPEVKHIEDAERMLKRYLGDLWEEEHRTFVAKLVGYPGAFIREVAVYALTQLAEADGSALSLQLLQQSFDGLKEQVIAREGFFTGNTHHQNGVERPRIFGEFA